MFVKICGITRDVDARHAVEQGATALGFVFWPRSPRAVTVDRVRGIVSELPAGVTTVGVFVDEPADGIRRILDETGVQMAQLHGDELPSVGAAVGRPLLRSLTLDRAQETADAWPDALLLLDAADPIRRGGTGVRVDWPRAAAVAGGRRVVLAGGLTPDNVAEAIRIVRPFGVDVSSGVEAVPGVKDSERVSRFIGCARRALEALTREQARLT